MRYPGVAACGLRVAVFVAAVVVAGVVPASAGATPASATPTRVLVVFEGGADPFGCALGDARQLRQLLGHFATEVALTPADAVQVEDLARAEVAFVVGFHRGFALPPRVAQDLAKFQGTLVWINAGIEDFGRHVDLAARWGFAPDRFDTTSGFDTVIAGSRHFTKTEPNLEIVHVTDPTRCTVLATARASKTNLEAPYAVRSGVFWFIADSPFSYATEADRYLYFADLLHDILGQDHPVLHRALIRIEDTNPMSDPAALRAVADVLAARKIPFLVGVVPIYVAPQTATRVPMSEKPDYVDALRYMVAHGGTVVLHGDTHQFKGESTSDYEFWDESRDHALPGDSRELVERKLREGIEECLKNGVVPLLWETPHYSASAVDYGAIAAHFSTAVEQRLVLDRLDQSQYFPYVIERDLYGQRIYPENLGYIPLDDVAANEQASVDRLLLFAGANLQVRDGWASVFFHPFVRLEMLERLVDGIRALGFEFYDVRFDTHTVTLSNRAVVCGRATVRLALADQYLLETTYDREGDVVKREFSADRLAGTVERAVALAPGFVYVAEPREVRDRPVTWFETTRAALLAGIDRLGHARAATTPADVLHLVDAAATGGALNDQESLAAAFAAVNVPIERRAVTVAAPIDAGEHNLILVPYNVAESLTASQLAALVYWVEGGGTIVTDFRNALAAALGMRFLPSTLRIERVRDRLFPDETLRWRTGEVISKFEPADSDTIFATDDETEFPVAIGRRIGEGRLIFFASRFDPASTSGSSRFPYLVHWVQRFCRLTPLLGREQLELYFDPGFRHTVAIESLVTRWADAGVRVIHVGGWHEYPKYTYDYGRLIRLCHANGILVMCWIEPPQVSQKFWLEHPQWREKNFKGQDVRPSWRYPVALTDPACRTAAMAHYRSLLDAFDWDGVNLGELYFEAGRGIGEPDLFTPFHPSAREAFRRGHGFDPIELMKTGAGDHHRGPAALARFLDWRAETVTDLHVEMLTMLAAMRARRPGFEIMVTMLDSLAAPELRGFIGVDSARIAAVTQRFGATLQVEDPESMWSLDPRRYTTIAVRYRGLVAPERLALDLNVLMFRPEGQMTPFPTRIQTGTESLWLVNSAAAGAGRVAIYSESSVNPQDLAFLPAAYASRTRVSRSDDGWEIDTPTPVVLHLASSVSTALRDGERIHSLGRGRFLLPVGAYTVSPESPALDALSRELPDSSFLSITGDLLEKHSSTRSVDFRYRSQTRCLVTLSREPFALFIDGLETAFTALQGAGRAGLMLPPGEHRVLVVTQSRVSWGVDITSFWSSSFIAAFGAVAAGLLVVLWLLVRLRRTRTA